MFKGRRIFVAEDEALIAMILEDILGELQCDVVASAATLDEAEKLAQSTDFDVAILDVNLDGRDCFALADRIIADGRTVVFATGTSPGSLPPRFQGQTIIEKPYAMHGVAAALTHIFSGSAAA